MKKTLLTNEVLEIYFGIEEFVKKDINLPVQFAWDLEDNSNTLKAIVSKFEHHRDELLSSLKEKDAFEPLENNVFKVKKPYEEEFKKISQEIENYANTKNEIEIKTVCKDEIPDSISVKDLRALKFMICDNADK